MVFLASAAGLLAIPRAWKVSTGSLMQYCLICSIELVWPSGSVRLEMWIDLSSVHGPALRMPDQIRDMSQMPQPVKVTPFACASASISAAMAGSLLCGR